MTSTSGVSGFLAGGIASGIKKRGAKDLALIFCPGGATVAGVFTTNRIQSPAVRLSRERATKGKARAILVNSGCANTYTGAAGEKDARSIGRHAARLLGVGEEEILQSSTGVIGSRLPLSVIRRGLPRLVDDLSPGGFANAAEAILTTDTHAKIATRQGRLPGGAVRLLGIAKGAGMVEPHMATMLVYLVTNARIGAPLLRRLLRVACDATFNRLTIDGCMSTSDTAIIMASGEGHRETLKPRSAATRLFSKMLHEVCADLATQLVSDGEGATKRVTVAVRGANSDGDARVAGYAVANSLLVKTAIHGEDPNWGRIIQALGAAPVRLAPDRISIKFGAAAILRRGRYAGAAVEARARRVMQGSAYTLLVDLGLGQGGAEVLTCDLSAAYVRINASYRT